MLNDLLARNQEWSNQPHAEEPNHFTRLAALQAPEVVWIGCSDSRVLANEDAGLDPGNAFVHRTAANIAHSLPLALEFAVGAPKVRDLEFSISPGHFQKEVAA